MATFSIAREYFYSTEQFTEFKKYIFPENDQEISWKNFLYWIDKLLNERLNGRNVIKLRLKFQKGKIMKKETKIIRADNDNWEKEMATHSNILAWWILWSEEPGGLPSMGSQRVGHHWSDLAAAAMTTNVKTVFNYKGYVKRIKDREMQVQSLGWEIPWSREWKPTPVFFPGKFHGQRSLATYSLWGCKESDMTEHARTLLFSN